MMLPRMRSSASRSATREAWVRVVGDLQRLSAAAGLGGEPLDGVVHDREAIERLEP